MSIINIGIIDDDNTKIVRIQTRITLDGKKFSNKEKQDKYKNFDLVPIEIEILTCLEEMVASVIENELDCVVIDYKLSQRSCATYSGVNLAVELEKSQKGLPIFILTSYEDDLYNNETFDAYQIFDYDRYMSDLKETEEVHGKIIEQVLKTRREIDLWIKRLDELLPHQGESSAIDNEIAELDTKIEMSIDGKSALTQKNKQELNSSKLDELIEKIDMFLEKE